MGITRTDIFTQEQNDLAQIAKAIGHPARIAIIEYLVRLNACVCGELVDEIGLAQATISQHLKELKAHGLIYGEIDGTRVCYCLNFDRWQEIQARFDQLFQGVSQSQKNCC